MPLRFARHADDHAHRTAAWVNTQTWRDRATVLKHDDPVTVYRGLDQDGRPIVVKRMIHRGLKRRIQCLLGRSRLARQDRGAALLDAAHIATPHRRARFRAGNSETLVLDWVEGQTLAELAEHAAHDLLHGRAAHAIARAIGTHALTLARAGIFNRDHKASNLIVRRADTDNPEIVLIDTVGLRRGLTAVDLMLAKTAIELIGINALPRRALLLRALQAAEPRHTKTAWRAITQVIARHGDPTPRVNPLAPRQATPAPPPP